MNVEITTRHCEIPDHLKERVQTRMAKMLRFDERIMEARVVVSLDKNRYRCEANVLSNGVNLVSHAEEDSDKVALEQVLDRLETQVKKHRDRQVRIKNKQRSSTRDEILAGGMAPPPEPEEEHADDAFGDDSDYHGLIHEDPGDFAVDMPVAEAVAQLKASHRDALGFTNRLTGRPMLLYKRRDGNVGMVDIEL